jgi:dTMP kinase
MFISFDGGEGCGKSTQIELTCKWLRSLGRNVISCRDPGTTEVGCAIRDILLHSSDLRIDRKTEMLLYMAARSQLVEQIIRPALQQEIMVVSDRYLLATIAYQGYAGGLDIDDIRRVGCIVTEEIIPDVTFYLDISPQVAYKRIDRQLDRMESMGMEFHQRVRSGYLTEAAEPQNRIVVIDATKTVDEVQAIIRPHICDILS